MTDHMRRRGWFSDIDPDGAPPDGYQWQPCLQLDGLCLSFDVWHGSKEDCDDFILTEIIGRPFLDAVEVSGDGE